jgi:hypothetical protein
MSAVICSFPCTQGTQEYGAQDIVTDDESSLLFVWQLREDGAPEISLDRHLYVVVLSLLRLSNLKAENCPATA